MHVVKGMTEIAGPAGGGNALMDKAAGYLGHTPGKLAMAWNAVAKAEPGTMVPMKALLAVAAYKGIAATKAMLALGAVEYAIA